MLRAVRENLPEHNYISGQFLSGITSPNGQPLKSMAANADLFEVAKVIRQDEALAYEVIVTPSAQLMGALRANPAATAAVAAIDEYLAVCKCSCRLRLLSNGTVWTQTAAAAPALPSAVAVTTGSCLA